jgi:branched-chain amino acid transport system substrate-binding protein
MGMLRQSRVLALAVMFGTMVPLAGCSHSSSTNGSLDHGTITIGVELPLSGADASDGIPTANAVRLAVRDANQSGLIPGYRLAVEVRDDAVNGVHDPQKGSENFKAFVADATDLGVIGPLNSNVAQTLIPLSNSNTLALISPANTSPFLTKGSEALSLRKDHPLEITYFRDCPTDDVQGSAGATFAYVTLGSRRAYVMDDNATFGRGVADQWASQFRSEGGSILGHLHASPGQTDFNDMIRAASEAGVDIVFFGGESSTGAALARKQMAGTPLAHTTYISGDGIQNQQFLDVAGAESDNSYATVAAANAAKLPTADHFMKEYRTEYGQSAGAYSANAYAAAMVLVQAIAKVVHEHDGAMPTREQVLEQLRSTTTFSSILGVFSFDQNGDTTLKIISIWKAKNRHWTFLTQRNFAQ